MTITAGYTSRRADNNGWLHPENKRQYWLITLGEEPIWIHGIHGRPRACSRIQYGHLLQTIRCHVHPISGVNDYSPPLTELNKHQRRNVPARGRVLYQTTDYHRDDISNSPIDLIQISDIDPLLTSNVTSFWQINDQQIPLIYSPSMTYQSDNAGFIRYQWLL